MTDPDTAEAKKPIRALIGRKRRALDPAWVKAASEAIAGAVVQLDAFASATVVCSYVAVPGEVDTRALIAACRARRKQVCVPALRKETARYEWAWFPPGAELVTGSDRVPEPSDKAWAPVDRVEFVVVPGVAFDRSGTRLGRGGGHYDRLLAECPGFKAGVAFEFQVLHEIPRAPHDVRMDAVVTEANVYRARSSYESGV
ncbi:MAG: 5-formyltetrahydrofolate cyclo-ligase [Kiritimatiellae bacterium]|nr:5-formyltetrahydrofolate cyclo-ligase [Kiritimatiellia bacterium]